MSPTWVVPHAGKHVRCVDAVADAGHEDEVLRPRGGADVRIARVAVVDDVIQVQALRQVIAVRVRHAGRAVQRHEQAAGMVSAGLWGARLVNGSVRDADARLR